MQKPRVPIAFYPPMSPLFIPSCHIQYTTGPDYPTIYHTLLTREFRLIPSPFADRTHLESPGLLLPFQVEIAGAIPCEIDDGRHTVPAVAPCRTPCPPCERSMVPIADANREVNIRRREWVDAEADGRTRAGPGEEELGSAGETNGGRW